MVLFVGQLTCCASIQVLKDDSLYKRAVPGESIAAAAKSVLSHSKSTKAIKEAPKLLHQPSLSRSSSSASHASHATHSSLSKSPSLAHTDGGRGRSISRGSPTIARYHSEPPMGNKEPSRTPWKNIHISQATKKNGIIAGGSAALGMILGNVQVNTPTVDLQVVHHGGKKLSMNGQLSQGGISSNLNAGGASINMNKMTRARSFGGHGSEPEYY